MKKQETKMKRSFDSLPLNKYIDELKLSTEKSFKFNEQQKNYIETILNNEKIIVKKSRNIGETTCFLYYLLNEILANKTNALLVFDNLNSSMGFFSKIKESIYQICRNEDVDKIFIKNSRYGFVINYNKSYIKIYTGKDCLIGENNFDIVYLGEFDFMRDFETLFYELANARINVKKLILSSTINNQSEAKILENLYTDDKNSFAKISLDWYKDPRFNKDLEWTKEDCENVKEKDFTLESIDKMVKLQYIPTSPWYLNHKKYYFSDNDIKSEIDNVF